MGRSPIKEAQYDAVKLLLTNTKMTRQQIADSLGVGLSSVDRIATTDSYKQFSERRLENSRKYYNLNHCGKEKPQKEAVERQQTVTIQASFYMQKELEKTNELLTIISNKLAFIVDELCGVKPNAE